MLSMELKRYFKSKISIAGYILCFLPAVISFYFSYLDFQEMKELLVNAPNDANIANVKKYVEGTNAYTYLFTYFSSSDLFILFIIILLLVVGTTICTVEYKNRTTGLGNMIYTRTDQLKGTAIILMAQLLYVFCFVGSYYVLLFLGSHILFPVDLRMDLYLTIPVDHPTVSLCIRVILSQMIKVICFLGLVTMLVFFFSIFVKNVFMISIMPVFFEFVPLFTCTILAGVSEFLGTKLGYLIPDVFLLSPFQKYVIEDYDGRKDIIWIFFYLIVFGISGAIYFRKIKRAYL